jgi:class 3 adenylate cyclase/predicted ATPase
MPGTVADWLRDLGLEQYVSVFQDNEIDTEVLRSLTVDDLKDLGITLVGHRRKLLTAIQALRETDAEIANTSATTAVPDNVQTADPAAAERRQITTMFCDLVGSTELAERLDPEDLREIVHAYHGLVTEEVTRYGGFVAKFMGDGVLAYFGYPRAHEDDAERSVRAGLKIAGSLARLPVPESLQVRIGIATGLVVVGDLIGSGASREWAVVGETPNLAARLQALAEPDAVIVADNTRRQLGELFELRDLGFLELKGFSEQQRAWRVVRESDIESRFAAFRRPEAPLVGRGAELDLLLQAWNQAKSGEGRVVLISAEPGLGKSRLTEALAERIAAENPIRLRYFCSPHHQDSAWYPVIGQLERAAGFARNDGPQENLQKLAALIDDQDLPLFADLLSLPIPNGLAKPDLSPQRKKELTFEALLRQLEALARRQPVLMVFEDLHWVDPTTLEMFARTVARIRDLPILLIATFRPEFPAPWADQPHVTKLSLAHLDRREGAMLVQELIANAINLSPRMLEEIVERTDGVPLFLEEVTKVILEAAIARTAGGAINTIPDSQIAVPPTLQASLMARLDLMDTAAREVAQLGAVIGREFTYELLRHVAQRPEAELNAALDRLTDARLVFCRRPPPHATYIFKHALIQDTAYQSLLKRTRQQYHLRIARTLAEQFDEVMETQPELLAHHYSAGGDAQQAIFFWRRAGQRASERSAHVEAINHLTRGLELLKTLPASTESEIQQLELQTRLGSAFMATKGYAAPETREAYAQARLLGQRVGTTQQLFPVLRGLWIHHIVRAEFAPAEELGEQCLGLAQSSQDPTLLPEAHFALGGTQLWLGNLSPAVENMQAGIAHYDPEQHRTLISLYGQDPGMACLTYAAWDLWLLGYPDQALRNINKALSLTRDISHPYSQAVALSFAARLHQLRREAQAAQQLADAAIALATEQGFAYWVAQGTILHRWALAIQGNEQAGVAEMHRALADLSAVGAELLGPYLLALLAETHGANGHTDEGLRVLADALHLAARTKECWWKAELHRLRGELLLLKSAEHECAAEDCFQEALDLARTQKARSLELRAAMSLARVWLRRGKRQDARDLLAPVRGWFTEGFATADLQEADALLHQMI